MKLPRIYLVSIWLVLLSLLTNESFAQLEEKFDREAKQAWIAYQSQLNNLRIQGKSRWQNFDCAVANGSLFFKGAMGSQDFDSFWVCDDSGCKSLNLLSTNRGVFEFNKKSDDQIGYDRLRDELIGQLNRQRFALIMIEDRLVNEIFSDPKTKIVSIVQDQTDEVNKSLVQVEFNCEVYGKDAKVIAVFDSEKLWTLRQYDVEFAHEIFYSRFETESFRGLPVSGIQTIRCVKEEGLGGQPSVLILRLTRSFLEITEPEVQLISSNTSKMLDEKRKNLQKK